MAKTSKEQFPMSPGLVDTLLEESKTSTMTTPGSEARHNAHDAEITIEQRARRRSVGGLAARAARAVGHRVAPDRVRTYREVEDTNRRDLHYKRLKAEQAALEADPRYQQRQHDNMVANKMRAHLDTGYVDSSGTKVHPYRLSPYASALRDATSAHRAAERIRTGDTTDFQKALGADKLAEIEARLRNEAATHQERAMEHLVPTEVGDLSGRRHDTLSRPEAEQGMHAVALEEHEAWKSQHEAPAESTAGNDQKAA